jgi:hypothetical protein
MSAQQEEERLGRRVSFQQSLLDSVRERGRIPAQANLFHEWFDLLSNGFRHRCHVPVVRVPVGLRHAHRLRPLEVHVAIHPFLQGLPVVLQVVRPTFVVVLQRQHATDIEVERNGVLDGVRVRARVREGWG